VSVCQTEAIQSFAAGRKPAGVAAAVIYLLSRQPETDHENVLQRELAAAAGVSEATIRKSWQVLDERLDGELGV
jgi:Transcription initiation factor TFIIIB, Brf1 subunit/Transcription initiation factor TFIIB